MAQAHGLAAWLGRPAGLRLHARGRAQQRHLLQQVTGTNDVEWRMMSGE